MKHLVDTTDPRQREKVLTGNLSGVWRYRVGDYCMVVTIESFEVAHRREIYQLSLIHI